MRVYHVSAGDSGGGSARSAFKIHRGLLKLGAESNMLVAEAQSGLDSVKAIWPNKTVKAFDLGIGRIFDAAGLQYLCYPWSYLTMRMLDYSRIDLIQLYNLHGGYFSYPALTAIPSHIPIVWRLSDMWPFTGHCAYSLECEKWQDGCDNCPNRESYPSIPLNTASMLWRIKKSVCKHLKLTVVAPSKWMKRCAEQSPILGRFPVHYIPNGLDTTVYKPVPKQVARKAIGLGDEKVILFSAAMLTEERKGASHLKSALEELRHEPLAVKILLMGRGEVKELPFPYRSLGQITSDESMALAYSAADIFALPSIADNLPNSILESMSCGTPVVSFDAGGISDAVRHLETGYLAETGNAAELAQGLKTLLSDDALRGRLGDASRRLVKQEFTEELQARNFFNLFQNLVS